MCTLQQNSQKKQCQCMHLSQHFHYPPWNPANAKSAGVHQLEVFTDASLIALAYLFPSLQLAYHAPCPPTHHLTPSSGLKLFLFVLPSITLWMSGHVNLR
jgi:hypothetical protein